MLLAIIVDDESMNIPSRTLRVHCSMTWSTVWQTFGDTVKATGLTPGMGQLCVRGGTMRKFKAEMIMIRNWRLFSVSGEDFFLSLLKVKQLKDFEFRCSVALKKQGFGPLPPIRASKKRLQS